MPQEEENLIFTFPHKKGPKSFILELQKYVFLEFFLQQVRAGL
jgi:hypothetical protein